MIKPGFYAELPMKDYQADEAISGSDLVSIAQNGIERWKFNKTQPRDVSRAMDIGTAVHHMVGARLIGGDSAPLIQVYSDGSSLTNAFKAFRAKMTGDAVAVDLKEMSLIERCSAAILNDKECRRYLDDAVIEGSFFSVDSETGVSRKCRPDFLNVKERVSINIKTTQDASDSGFIRSVKDWGYAIQTVNYQDVLKQVMPGEDFIEIHILAEKSDAGPIKIAIRAIDDDTLDHSRWITRRILKVLQKAAAENNFKDPAPKLQTCLIPAWARPTAEWLNEDGV
jgi:hypothetical protein